jgi:hypothetical protein
MAALTTIQELTAIREAIQLLTTLDGSGKRRDVVSISVDGMSKSYSSAQLPQLENRERELLRRLSIRNVRKRTQPEFN